eukprot:Sspe_Gene.28854::Locus_13288_Transcript_1_2_Confidence_0.500_Length_371::g.28854::m.28854
MGAFSWTATFIRTFVCACVIVCMRGGRPRHTSILGGPVLCHTAWQVDMINSLWHFIYYAEEGQTTDSWDGSVERAAKVAKEVRGVVHSSAGVVRTSSKSSSKIW